MPFKHQVLTDPIKGDVYEFLETAQDSQGERVSIKMTVKTKGQLVPMHLHMLQDEHFTVLSGQLTVLQEGKSQVLQAGESIVLPKNEVHNHFNNHDEPVEFIQTVSPALDFDYFIENLINYTIDHQVKGGKFGLIQQLVTSKYIASKSYVAGIPIPVQNFLMNVVGPIAKLFGVKALYAEYCGINK